jgi:serine/threonine protein kinase
MHMGYPDKFPTEVSHYRIHGIIGKGGMGIIYKAIDTGTSQTVALKFLHPHIVSDPRARKNLIEEARSAARLNHPNICSIYEINETEDGQVFISMAYYDGETLAQRIRTNRPGPDESRVILTQIAEGLAAAHRSGIVHRDIKPENIILAVDGHTAILDFGVARQRIAGSTITPDDKPGSLAYMAPELVIGSGCSESCDIWSFGVLAYELLSGQLPFRGDFTQSLIYEILNEDPASPKQYLPDIPEDLAQLCLACLQKEPENRPASFGEILDDLYLSGSHFTEIDPVPSPVKRRPSGLIAGFAITVIILLAFFYSDFGTDLTRPQSTVLVLPVQQWDTSNDHRALQYMFASTLSGIPGISVFEPHSLNYLLGNQPAIHQAPLPAGHEQMELDFILSARILPQRNKNILRLNLHSYHRDKVVFSIATEMAHPDSLYRSVQSLTQMAAAYITGQTEYDQEELSRPDRSTAQGMNLSAVRAFLAADPGSYSQSPESRELLQQTLAIDSLFVPARVWLIPLLVADDERVKARYHVRFLSRHREHANYYYQTLIDWVTACCADNRSAQEQALRKALDIQPGSLMLQYNLAQLLYARGDYQSCQQVLHTAISSRWPWSPVYYLQAGCALKKADYLTALSAITTGLQCRPVYPHLYYLQARALYLLGRPAEALEAEADYLIATEQAPRYRKQGFVFLSSLNYSNNRFRQALQFSRAALQIDPSDVPAQTCLCGALIETGQPQPALDTLRIIVARDSANSDALFYLGKAHFVLQNYDKAENIFSEFIRRFPGNPAIPEASRLLASIH